MQASGESLSQSGLVKHGLKLDMKDSIISSFKKCDLWVALDGSENHELNIDNLPVYQMSSAFVLDNECVLDDDSESEKEDEG